MKIRMRVSIASADFNARIGEELDVSEDQAQVYCANGWSEQIEAFESPARSADKPNRKEVKHGNR